MFQVHSTAYRRPSDVPDGTVLVVGGGNTGFQIAEELAATHKVCLAVGSRQTPLPQRLLGRDLFWWLTTSRLLKTTVESRIGRRLQHRDTLIGSSPRDLRTPGVELKQRAVDADGRKVRSRTAASSRSTRSSGRPATGPTTPGSIFRCSTPTGASVIAVA